MTYGSETSTGVDLPQAMNRSTCEAQSGEPVIVVLERPRNDLRVEGQTARALPVCVVPSNQ